MSRRIVLPVAAAALLAAAGSGACYEDDSSGPATSKPMAKVLMTDAPFPFDTVQGVHVYVVSVATSTEPDTGSSPDNMHWVTITEPKKRIDLLTLQQGTTTLLGEGEIPADNKGCGAGSLDPRQSRRAPARHHVPGGKRDLRRTVAVLLVPGPFGRCEVDPGGPGDPHVDLGCGPGTEIVKA